MFPPKAILVARFVATALVASWLAAPRSAAADQPQPAQAAAAGADNRPPSAEGIELFEKQIRPLLVQNCLECHGEKRKGGLRLDSRGAMLAGGDNGPAIALGRPEDSPLVQAVRYQDEPKMPPRGKLPDEAIGTIAEWIRMGAPWPTGETIGPAGAAAADAWKSHWAFQPIKAPPLPKVARADWPQTPLDYFVLARLEQQGLTPSPAADRRTLLRRASYDVTGLPPTAAEVEALVADSDPRAFIRASKQLLASPHYGERWARHWLDVARYADTKGYVFEADRSYPNAYRYRDWVVRAFNEDLPYDEFLVRQIAADRLGGDDNSRLAAMGFLTVGRRFLNNTHDIIDDRLDVLTRGTMALTVTCARCHDHKYDPIPTEDYYSLYGVLASSTEPEQPAEYMTLADAERPLAPHVFVRGNPGNLGPPVPRRFLSLLAGENRRPFRDGSGRLELARAIASRDNPLTARVIVNRVWAYYFGAPLVDTPSDFGMRSQPPSHPELLDYLAAWLVDHGWSLKGLAQMILHSATYQQASNDRPECRAADSENRWLWRMNRKRMDFEGLRDSLLAVSGQLDRTLGGPAVELTRAPWSRRRTIYGLVDRQNLPSLFRTFDFASPDTHSPQRFSTTVPQQALYLMNSPFIADQARALAARPELAADGELRTRIEHLYGLVLCRAPTAHEVAQGLAFVADEQAREPSGAGASEAVPAGTSPPPAAATAASAAGAANPARPADESEDDRGTAGPPLSAWERYVQIVLVSNEFVYID